MFLARAKMEKRTDNYISQTTSTGEDSNKKAFLHQDWNEFFSLTNDQQGIKNTLISHVLRVSGETHPPISNLLFCEKIEKTNNSLHFLLFFFLLQKCIKHKKKYIHVKRSQFLSAVFTPEPHKYYTKLLWDTTSSALSTLDNRALSSIKKKQIIF